MFGQSSGGYGGYQTYKSEVVVNGPSKSWTPTASGYKSSSTQWAPAPAVTFPSGGGSYGGPPMASGDQDVIWDEARGGYWVKETIVDAGYSTSMNSGGYSASGAPGNTTALGWSGCRGCASVPAKSSCGCQSNVGMASRSGCGCHSQVLSLPQTSSCKCSSKSNSAYPVVQQSAFLYGGRSCAGGGCRGGSAISCGCHTTPSCNNCGAYH